MTLEARKLAAARRVWANLRNRCKRLRHPLPPRQRIIDMALAAIGHRCFYCEGRVTAKTASIDHLFPVERGGLTKLGNLIVCHARCNRRKGILLASEMGELTRMIQQWAPEARRYVLTKLSSAPAGFWRARG